MAKPIFQVVSAKSEPLFPPNLEDLIASPHPVRLVSRSLNPIDIAVVLKMYKVVEPVVYPRCCFKGVGV